MDAGSSRASFATLGAPSLEVHSIMTAANT